MQEIASCNEENDPHLSESLAPGKCCCDKSCSEGLWAPLCMAALAST